MSKAKPAKTPWTKAQRGRLSAILHPSPNDPPDFILSAEDAWSRTGFGKLPATWTKDLEKSVVERALRADTDVMTPLVAYFVATRGVEGALVAITDASDPERRFDGYGLFRRYVATLDDATFARVREWMLYRWDELPWMTKVSRAFVLSRDPSIARALFESSPEIPSITGALMVAVGDPSLAARVLEASEGVAFALPESFDLVEAYGAAAEPLLAGVLERFAGKGASRKPVEDALKLARALAASSPAEGREPAKPIVVAAKAGPSFPEEADYGLMDVVVAGSFHLPDDIVRARLRARGLQDAAKTPSRSTKAYFEGAGAKPALREKAEKHKVPVFGEAELRQLIATPLFRFRERATEHIERELESPFSAVATWYVGPPATEAQLAAAEAALGVPLDPALRALYAQCNGLQLRYDSSFSASSAEVPKAEPQKLAPEKRSWGDVGTSIGKLGNGTGGVVSILPLDELVRSRSFGADPSEGRGRTVQLGKRKVDLERFRENLYVFDFWYDFYPVALHVDRERGAYEIVIGDDHGAVWDDPDVESVETYLERVAETFGAERAHGKRFFQRPR